VRLTDAATLRLAAFLRLSEFDFIQQFTRLRSNRRGLALQEKPNGECIFLHGNDCAVQPVKPQPCRDFPNLWRRSDFGQSCRAIPLRVEACEWHQLVAAATGRAPEEVARLAGDGVHVNAAQTECSSAGPPDAEIP
jgi:Fe-S-cluster containining protein